ncbi:hypothetical protein [Paracoccus tegillarcae]|uniref:Tat pathway signal protein n=1 Tax=Paracoccus tegillarcae TaxID=1529068 RepID=A0A2K9EF27_9RHOB|nr:hypothetical protein [Paracoccus tegillarcae]AUH32939.1 hypothetical protein CUV01_05615 [Paracoccus tegillarcae]
MPAPRHGKTPALSALIATALLGFTAIAHGQDVAPDAQPDADEGRIMLELNNATDTDGGACRMTFVATNNSPESFERTGWQVGIFDAQGIVRSILALEFGALSASKTKIVLFDLPGRGCDDISRVVVNDVTLCQPEGSAEGEVASACLDALTTRSRENIEFGI